MQFEKYKNYELVDTTGAGDSYIGGLAIELSQGKSVEEAMILANKTGFLSITKFGAAPSIPYLEDVKKLELI